MSRADAVRYAAEYFDSGAFLAELSRRVAYRTESQDPERLPELRAYLDEELVPAVARLGCTARIVDNPVAGRGPLLVARRHEDDRLPTVLTYGHADVVLGEERRWRAGLHPWRVVVEQDRWYGRGTADNKGQHTINLAALEQVLRARNGRLGFNLAVLVETGEEAGSPGLRQVCADLRDELAADLLVASDGPRLAAERPTLFLGSRGSVLFTLRLRLRDGAHHSGNWGGLLRNPATVLASALASLVDAHGRILVPGLRPPSIPDNVRRALAELSVGGGPDDPVIDEDWGEPGLSPAERLVGWNTLEVLSLAAGNPDTPINAIPGAAHAHCQLRYVVGTDVTELGRVLREHLDARGFPTVEVAVGRSMPATRTDPDNRWVRWAVESVARTTGAAPALLPNLGGTIPNDAFADELGLPTIWLPHSYPACAQHAPDEHLLGSVARQSLRIMAGLFWDLGEVGPVRR
ncbi:M20 family metallopeptidase [Goodfellowiella coeruleoviolacea]|uniref:Acetylornithine deacetylase/Succinyl-diaminopimelate desuccinylase n=1 Tax=Goodfellowiella coeruleoviolacea TaxID=334858 RepID=A0AAE3GD67_9PSEU|nr:M20 family metallopeptidase [Goodfellowiella coeruleoviolacea]MCP2166136.1 Acetylornithine deacetylase/Succinyl-diaminopimelate desuccinylase [Goodfellowiella coeruleoviolacea]